MYKSIPIVTNIFVLLSFSIISVIFVWIFSYHRHHPNHQNIKTSSWSSSSSPLFSSWGCCSLHWQLSFVLLNSSICSFSHFLRQVVMFCSYIFLERWSSNHSISNTMDGHVLCPRVNANISPRISNDISFGEKTNVGVETLGTQANGNFFSAVATAWSAATSALKKWPCWKHFTG